ncbi:MAG: ankyrin repeat domain-containing protein, partial [Pseudomonadota bacterium]
RAAEKGDLESLSIFITNQPWLINFADSRDGGKTALHYAAGLGKVDVVVALLAAGADVLQPTTMGSTPMMLAAENGQAAVISVLNSAVNNVDFVNNYGSTVMHYAAEGGDVKALKAALAAGGNPNAIDKRYKTPLHLLAEAGCTESMAVILNNPQTRVNQRDEWGYTAGHLAVERGHHHLLPMLKVAGADLDIGNNHGKTAGHLAAEKCYSEALESLFELQANLNLFDFYDFNIAMSAVTRNCSTIIEGLKNFGVDLDASNSHNKTAAHMAAEAGNLLAIKELHRLGAKVLLPKSVYGQTPLDQANEYTDDEATKNGRAAVAKYLNSLKQAQAREL